MNIKTNLKTFFDKVYNEEIHISCLELPILIILAKSDNWVARKDIINELKKYGDFKRQELSFDHLWSQRFGKGYEKELLNSIVEHNAKKNGDEKTQYKIKDENKEIVKSFLSNYEANIESLILLRLAYTNIEKIEKKEDEVSTPKIGNLDFPHKNILLKGVPGTGKSRAIENIINKQLELEDHKKNVLRINIHSASSNADLMQGIGISSSNGKIEYKEKQGLILDIIQRATFKPKQPFVLILEEIQENSLNELIGDLIYLIEDDKRAKNIVADGEEYEYQALVEKIIEADPTTSYVEIPYLVNDSTEYRKMIMPNNLYIFCTSNYRDDKKVIEDNLLRRFEVLEVYPKERVAHEYCRAFFKGLNENILSVLKDEIHPDRFLIGHAIWKDVSDTEKFYRAFLKVVVEFKDIKEIEFDEFKKILKNLPMPEALDLTSYKTLIEDLQTKAGYDFLND